MVQERIRNTTFVPDAAGYTTISFDWKWQKHADAVYFPHAICAAE